MWRRIVFCFLPMSFLAMPALGADIVTGASPSVHSAGSEARIWITGRGFQAGAMVSISGPGITQNEVPQVIPEAERVDGGRGDGIIYGFSVAQDAQIGSRNITVSDSGGTATGMGFIQITAPEPMNPGNNNNNNNNNKNKNNKKSSVLFCSRKRRPTRTAAQPRMSGSRT
ncbi:MAG: hypothetical protein CMH52_09235 [Myxococcales bacterium]|nr:hypothetical protein [Myxococcales bacterium]